MGMMSITLASAGAHGLLWAARASQVRNDSIKIYKSSYSWWARQHKTIFGLLRPFVALRESTTRLDSSTILA
jgi:hypothetical protein